MNLVALLASQFDEDGRLVIVAAKEVLIVACNRKPQSGWVGVGATEDQPAGVEAAAPRITTVVRPRAFGPPCRGGVRVEVGQYVSGDYRGRGEADNAGSPIENVLRRLQDHPPRVGRWRACVGHKVGNPNPHQRASARLASLVHIAVTLALELANHLPSSRDGVVCLDVDVGRPDPVGAHVVLAVDVQRGRSVIALNRCILDRLILSAMANTHVSPSVPRVEIGDRRGDRDPGSRGG